jgi:hypothetical protein
MCYFILFSSLMFTVLSSYFCGARIIHILIDYPTIQAPVLMWLKKATLVKKRWGSTAKPSTLKNPDIILTLRFLIFLFWSASR